MKLICTKSVFLNTEEEYKAFTEGKEYRARKGHVQGLNGDPYGFIRVLRAKNDKRESHIIKHFDDNSLNNFFSEHFKEIQ